ncbi:hypothetical protein A2G96_02775 [Cupriavidus nantongensis]|uniref:Uncharacterized protein n=1 Tax=Cupriavidus nantongensis TaxID=1796606 RepID=A0A142JF87_9BURK|nr:hypothetical protein A2G96_02775 [Cupriavidus nantongensis]
MLGRLPLSWQIQLERLSFARASITTMENHGCFYKTTMETLVQMKGALHPHTRAQVIHTERFTAIPHGMD